MFTPLNIPGLQEQKGWIDPSLTTLPSQGFNHSPMKNVQLILFANILDPGFWFFLLVLPFSAALKGFLSLCVFSP